MTTRARAVLTSVPRALAANSCERRACAAALAAREAGTDVAHVETPSLLRSELFQPLMRTADEDAQQEALVRILLHGAPRAVEPPGDVPSPASTIDSRKRKSREQTVPLPPAPERT
jgi:hypothetical protein